MISKLSLVYLIRYIIFIGFIFWKHHPKQINGTLGWRTERSMKNQETWHFANSLGGKCTLILGAVEFLCTLIFLFISSNIHKNEDSMFMIVLVIVIIQSACLGIVYVHVERKLRKHFNQ